METKYENVFWDNYKNKYRCRLIVNGKNYHVGYSHDPKELYEKSLLFREQKEQEWIKQLDNDCLPEEQWVDLNGFNGKFKVSNFGRVKSYSKIKCGIISNGKKKISIKNDGEIPRVIHLNKAVIEHFLEVEDVDAYKINHIDGDELNCRIDNLSIRLLSEIVEEEILKNKEIAKQYEGVTYVRSKRIFASEFECDGKRYRFRSSCPKTAQDKMNEFRNNLYTKYCEEVENQIQDGEEFRAIKETNNIYYISNKGRIIKDLFPLKTFLKGSVDKFNYTIVGIKKNGNRRNYAVQQLVAEAFLNHTIDGHTIVVDHIDHDRQNNCVENLQLLTNRQNASKKKAKVKCLQGVVKTKSGTYKAVIKMDKKKCYLGSFKTEREAHEVYKVKVMEVESNM